PCEHRSETVMTANRMRRLYFDREKGDKTIVLLPKGPKQSRKSAKTTSKARGLRELFTDPLTSKSLIPCDQTFGRLENCTRGGAVFNFFALRTSLCLRMGAFRFHDAPRGGVFGKIAGRGASDFAASNFASFMAGIKVVPLQNHEFFCRP